LVQAAAKLPQLHQVDPTQCLVLLLPLVADMADPTVLLGQLVDLEEAVAMAPPRPEAMAPRVKAMPAEQTERQIPVPMEIQPVAEVVLVVPEILRLPEEVTTGVRAAQVWFQQ
jgi:hypothetical protein